MDSYWLFFGYQDLYWWSFNHQKFNGAMEEIACCQFCLWLTNKCYKSNSTTSNFQTSDLRHSISQFWVLFPTINSWFSDPTFRLLISNFGLQFRVWSFIFNHWHKIFFFSGFIRLQIYDFQLLSLSHPSLWLQAFKIWLSWIV